jgi:hypothetical protein
MEEGLPRFVSSWDVFDRGCDKCNPKMGMGLAGLGR